MFVHLHYSFRLFIYIGIMVYEPFLILLENCGISFSDGAEGDVESNGDSNGDAMTHFDFGNELLLPENGCMTQEGCVFTPPFVSLFKSIL